MADSQHIQWLLEGVWAWNERRARDNFVPDFQDADVCWIFRSHDKLDHNGRVPLGGINLSGAVLDGANLQRANLYQAKLSRAGLRKLI